MHAEDAEDLSADLSPEISSPHRYAETHFNVSIWRSPTTRESSYGFYMIKWTKVNARLALIP